MSNMQLHPGNMIEPFWYFHSAKRNLSGIHSRINENAEFQEFCKYWDDESITEVSGMDCDGVRYSGALLFGPLSYYKYRELIENERYMAEGPIFFRWISKEDAKQVDYITRDLVAEAFENGHPHLLTTTGE